MSLSGSHQDADWRDVESAVRSSVVMTQYQVPH